MICGHCQQQNSTIEHVKACSIVENVNRITANTLPVLIPADEYISPTPKESAPPPFEPVETGVYEMDGEVYRVKWNKSETRRYAEKMTGQKGRWVFAKGAMALLRPEHKVSLERAKEYGQKTGVCMMCGRLLTNPTSVAEGIGPICAGRF